MVDVALARTLRGPGRPVGGRAKEVAPRLFRVPSPAFAFT
jgi:hypothetical protein